MNGADLTVNEAILPSFHSVCHALSVGWAITLEQMANWSVILSLPSSKPESFKVTITNVNLWRLGIPRLQSTLLAAHRQKTFVTAWQHMTVHLLQRLLYLRKQDHNIPLGYVGVISLLSAPNTQLNHTQDGVIEGCVEYEAVVPPMTCQSVLGRNHITIEQFFKWYVNLLFQQFTLPPC
jgi:hypothetical protein